jgi:uncharacterized membrane protein
MSRTRHPVTLALGRKLAPPRFLAFLILLPLAGLAHYRLFAPPEAIKSLAIGFDVAAALFLVSLIPLVNDRDAQAIRERADANAANRVVVLLVSTLLTVVIMAAIAGELPAARHGDLSSIVQLVVTLLLIWLFANSVYALHYAHDYYTTHPEIPAKDCGGLDFPGDANPGYADFAYFAFTLGMTFQTSDVEITATRVRLIALLHSFGAFVFNIGVIAFTINALGGS